MTPRSERSSEAGFTLLELLVSLAIVAILAAAQVAPFQRAIAARDRAEDTMERTSAARIVLQRLAEELRGAVWLEKGGRAPFAVADRTFDAPASELVFATTAARRVQSGPRDAVEIVGYRLEQRGPGQPGGRLLRDALPWNAAAGVPPLTAAMLEGVRGFQVRAWPSGAREWQPTWPGGTSGAAADLPVAVEVVLVLDDGTPDGAAYREVVALPLGPKS